MLSETKYCRILIPYLYKKFEFLIIYYQHASPKQSSHVNETIMQMYHCLVQDDHKLPDDDGEIPKSQGRGWRFDFAAGKSPLYLT